MTAALKSAVDRQEWIAVTIWEPSWMMQKYDVKFLKDPKGVFPPPQSYYWIGKKGFSAENPHAREVIASVYVPLADITAINAAVNEGKTMDEAVEGLDRQPCRPAEALGKHQERLTSPNGGPSDVGGPPGTPKHARPATSRPTGNANEHCNQ